MQKEIKSFSRDILKESGADHVKYREKIINMLKNAFCEEVCAWYQYFIIIPFIEGPERSAIQSKLKEQAEDELQDHAKWILERINQLGGDPSGLVNFSNLDLFGNYITPSLEMSVYSALEQNIKAERNAIETYLDLEKFTREIDPVTHLKVVQILEDEEEHLQNLLEFANDIK